MVQVVGVIVWDEEAPFGSYWGLLMRMVSSVHLAYPNDIMQSHPSVRTALDRL